MTCRRRACAQDITTCPDWDRMGSCWYFACKGFVHLLTGAHACADYSGDAEPQQEQGTGKRAA